MWGGFRRSAAVLAAAFVACSQSPDPPPQPNPTISSAIERQIAVYAAAIRQILGEPANQTRTIWLVVKRDPWGNIGDRFGRKLPEEVIEGLMTQLDELQLQPAGRFSEVFKRTHVKDGGIVVTVSPLRDRNSRAVVVGANVFKGEWNAYGGQYIVALRGGEWRVIRQLGSWVT